MILWRGSLAVLFLVFSFQTYADDFRCATQSRGREFSSTSFIVEAAQTAAVATCQNDPNTDNNDCSSNVACDDGNRLPDVACYTQSRGTEYTSSSEFTSLAQALTIGVCQAAPVSQNTDCSNYAVCDDQLRDYSIPRLIYSCTSSSNGRSFVRQGNFSSLALAEVIADCQNDPYTTNTDCQANGLCDNGNLPLPPDPVPAPAPDREITQITSVNGDYDPQHAQEIYVRPGDIITLSADLLDIDRGNLAMGDSVEDFIWKSNANTNACDAGDSGDCLNEDTGFHVNDYGVTYYVPYNIGESVLITVSSHNSSAVDSAGNATQDTIVLRNAAYNPVSYTPPTVVVTNPTEYPYNQFDPDYALAGHGRWVWIGQVRYFVPYTYTVAGEQEWVPYRNGYWAWEENDGWTWVSYDPWGWMTDHYGVWRYHGVYGWMWLPFEDRHYEPHTVTWFHDDTYVGWYPYFPSYTAGYLHGEKEGFVDGYWMGHEGGRHYGEPGYNFNAGYTVVHHEHVTDVNIITVVVNRTVIDRTTVIVIGNSIGQGNFYQHPGGHKDGSREFIEHNAPAAVVTVSVVINTRGGAQFRQPNQINRRPDVYDRVTNTNLPTRPVAVGTVALADVAHPQVEAHVLPPNTNGRGIAAPPHAVDASGNTVQLPPRTRNPAQPQANNPITGAKPVATPTPGPIPAAQTLPKFDPKRPVPAPVAAKPDPSKAAPTPAPKPIPATPAPQPPKATPKPAPNPTALTFSVSKAGTGNGTITGSGINCGSTCSVSVNPGTQMVLSALPTLNSLFQGWSGGCSGVSSCVVSVKANTNVTATFVAKPRPTPTPTPTPTPKPGPTPPPKPTPTPRPTPTPKPTPTPTPKPTPTPTPKPTPTPTPKPTPTPTPKPTPVPPKPPGPKPHPGE